MNDMNTHTTHGETGSPEFESWSSMKERCADLVGDHYKYYRGRGINIFPPWKKSFELFLQHIGRKPTPEHTLDRIDNSRGYIPGNVRWATPLEQGSNKRNNRIVTLNGESRTISEWSRVTGISYQTLYSRLNKGMIAEDILSPDSFRDKPVDYLGKKLTLKEWSRVFSLNYETLFSRVQRGLTMDEATKSENFKYHPHRNLQG